MSNRYNFFPIDNQIIPHQPHLYFFKATDYIYVVEDNLFQNINQKSAYVQE